MTDAFETGILEGVSIANICLEVGISEATFYRRRMHDSELESTIARAQEMASDANIDRTEELARTATAENWQVVQFQCRNAQWIAGKRKAKKYGERVAHTGADGGAIQIVSTIPRPGKQESE